MQDVTSNYVQASSGAGGTWADPQLKTDWANNGYGGDATIDNLSLQAGGWTVAHHLDDGFPDSATFIAGVGVPELSAGLGPPPTYLTGNRPQQTAEYFSPYNTSSPLSGYDRDVAPVTLDHGVITAAGPERVRVFTGQMLDVPVRRGKATLGATSATRLKLKTLVQPPAVYGLYQGANATWAITYALYASGVYAMPPPQEGCRLWIPFHGSVRSFLPATNFSSVDMFVSVGNLTGPARVDAPKWVDGPFVMGGRFNWNAEWVQRTADNPAVSTGLQLEPGTDLTTQAGSRGKLEFWVRGDDTWNNAVPGLSGTFNLWVNLSMTNANNTWVDVGIDQGTDSTDRKPYVWINDGTTNNIFRHSTPVPTDGEWHFVGLAWNIAGASSKRWVNLDGVVETNTTAFSTAGLPASEGWSTNMPIFTARMPISELQLTAGARANPDSFSWLRDIPFTPDAVVTPSTLELASIAESQPREAWELIASRAQAELASMRCDENDVFQYLGLGWWVQDEQQVVAEVVSTETTAGVVDINTDPTKVYNTIRVTYEESTNIDTYVSVFALRDFVQIPTGITDFIVSLNPAAVEVRGFAFTNVAAADTTESTTSNKISVNSASDGTGTYWTSAEVRAEVLEWNPGQAVIRVTNMTGSIQYLANNKGFATMNLAAKALDSTSAYVVDADTTSVAARGERGLAVNTPAIQTRLDARRLARNLKMALRKGVPTVENLVEFGDARRQPGDLIQFEDPSVTKASGLWRRQSITHRWEVDEDEVSYEQDSIVRPTLPICIVGEGLVGGSLVGPEE